MTFTIIIIVMLTIDFKSQVVVLLILFRDGRWIRNIRIIIRLPLELT